MAHNSQSKADQQADIATMLGNAQDGRIERAVARALNQEFGEKNDSKRFVNLARVPLICQSIETIHTDIREIKDMLKGLPGKYVSQESFDPYKQIVKGLVSLILMGFVGALISLVLKS